MSQPLRNEDAFYYYQKKEEPARRIRPGKAFNLSRSRLPAMVLSILLVYLVISFCSQFGKLTSMQRDVRDIQQQVQEVQQKNAVLREELRLAQSDAYIEKTAREKIGLVKPGEARIVTAVPADGSIEVEVPTEQGFVAD